ncbi:hypothetical protein GPALN_005923 [Globodera pallida]|nr:hypothetical protein GPALN_005923 [Globodera pallida]
MDSPTLEASFEFVDTLTADRGGGTFEVEENGGTFEVEENGGTFEVEKNGGTFEVVENGGDELGAADQQGQTISGQLLEILKTCKQLEESNDVEKLSRFLDALPPSVQMHVEIHERVLMARALISYNTVGTISIIR